MTIEVQWIADPYSASRRRFHNAVAMIVMGGIITLGCGKSAPEPVIAPTTTQSDVEMKSLPEPPGGMEMPAGAAVDATGEPGANSKSAPASSGGFEMPKDVPVDASSATPKSTELRFASWDEIEQTATNTGRITVVDMWSLACAPCLKEFPGLVRLHHALGDSVTCIGVDVDYDGRKTRPPETYQASVAEFLASVGAEFSNYISNTPSDDIFINVDIASIPAVLVYDAEGKLVKKFSDSGETIGFTYDKDIIPLVKKLAG